MATDPLAHRADAARALGATKVLQTRRAGSELLRPGCGNGLDVAFEVAGDDGAVATAVDAAPPGGLLVLVGIPDGDRTSFTASTARRKELTIALCRRMRRADLPRAIALAERRDVELASLVTDRYPLARRGQAFARSVERRGLKVGRRARDRGARATRSGSTSARSRAGPCSSTAPTAASSRRPSTRTRTA